MQIPDFDAASVLVVGDVMLDRYWTGDTGRISPEAPVPVVRVAEQHDRPGGAGNVALNIAALGAKVTLLGVVGDDADGRALEAQLRGAGVEPILHCQSGIPTITKLRVMSRHQQLLRLDFESPRAALDGTALLDEFERRLASAHVVVLSDYGKGTLVQAQPFIRAARAAGKPVLVDPKHKDFSVYRGATLLTPNRSEFEVAAGGCGSEEELHQRAQQLLGTCEIDALLVTRSEEGMSLVQSGQAPLRIAAQAREVFDVTGAGDTVIAALAVALAAGMPLAEAARLANLAAGIVVGKLGAATVSVPELRRALYNDHAAERGVVAETVLLQRVTDARAHGETVVMTNGCFDILHAGHVAYLEQARRLGDRLVVAVNDDDSVRRLKGETRPIVPLEQRMAVLAGLAAVDWVVPFSEDTPQRLICKVLPDVLVKGGDYQPHEIAGGECVTAAGGEVVILDFKEGCSTSNIIQVIRGRGD